MYRIPYRTFVIDETAPQGGQKFTTAHLIRIAMSQSADNRGLTSDDQLLLSDVMARVRAAEGKKLKSIELENAEYEGLKKRVDAARWPIVGDDVTTFIRDVRDCKRVD